MIVVVRKLIIGLRHHINCGAPKARSNVHIPANTQVKRLRLPVGAHHVRSPGLRQLSRSMAAARSDTHKDAVIRCRHAVALGDARWQHDLMMGIMLCGASDVRDLRKPFARVVREIGGEPWSYLDATIEHLNVSGSSWVSNSARSVQSADLCVFVVYHDFGEITWQSEMRTVIDTGKPFLVLAHSETWGDYQAFRRITPDLSEMPETNRRRLFLALQEAENKDLTIIPFDPDEFSDRLRQALGSLLKQGIDAIGAHEEDSRKLAILTAERNAAQTQLTSAIEERDAAQLAARESRNGAEVAQRSVSQIKHGAGQLKGKFDKLLAENSRLNAQLSHRRSLPFKVIGVTTLVALVLGGMAGNSLGNSTHDATSLPASHATQSGPATSAAPASGITLPYPADSDYVDMECARGKWIAILGQYKATDSPLASYKQRSTMERIPYLMKIDARSRIKNEYSQIMISRGERSCTSAILRAYGESPDQKIYLWMGPFDSKSSASAACKSLRYGFMDCFAVALADKPS